MKELKYTSSLARKFMLDYERSRKIYLSDCYNRCSTAMNRAYRECRNKMLDELGNSFRILTYNTFHITCGWIDQHGNLRIETPNYSFIIKDYLPF